MCSLFVFSYVVFFGIRWLWLFVYRLWLISGLVSWLFSCMGLWKFRCVFLIGVGVFSGISVGLIGR